MGAPEQQIDRDVKSALKLVTAPATEPVTTAEAKLHLRVDISTDDTHIDNLVSAARQHVEAWLCRALITQTWDYKLASLPSSRYIELPLAPLVSVTSVTYVPDGGNSTTFSSSYYAVDADAEPGRVDLVSTADWPSDALRPGLPITVRFVAGYGSASAVPKAIKQAILLLVGHWYENREAIAIAKVGKFMDLPLAVEALLTPYRMWSF